MFSALYNDNLIFYIRKKEGNGWALTNRAGLFKPQVDKYKLAPARDRGSQWQYIDPIVQLETEHFNGCSSIYSLSFW
jgi:hypothetical protein